MGKIVAYNIDVIEVLPSPKLEACCSYAIEAKFVLENLVLRESIKQWCNLTFLTTRHQDKLDIKLFARNIIRLPSDLNLVNITKFEANSCSIQTVRTIWINCNTNHDSFIFLKTKLNSLNNRLQKKFLDEDILVSVRCFIVDIRKAELATKKNNVFNDEQSVWQYPLFWQSWKQSPRLGNQEVTSTCPRWI